MKKVLALILAVLMVLSMVACAQKTEAPKNDTASTDAAASTTETTDTASTGETAANETLKIGLCQPLTGSMANSGLYSTHGVQLAIDEINEAGGLKVGDKTYTIELLSEDNEGKTDITINAVNKLISDGVVAIVGTNSSSTSMAAGPIATSEKVVMVSTTGTNPDVTQVGGEYMFRSCWIDSYQGYLAAKLAYETLGKRKAAILYNNADDYSTGIMDFFVQSFEEMGGETMTQAYAGAEIKDFKAQITAFKEWEPDVIFIECQAAEIPLPVQQIRELGMDTQIIGAASWDNELLSQLTPKEDLVGCVYVTTFCADSEEPMAKAFVEAYQAKWDGELPMNQATMSYNAMKIIAQALQDCGTVDDPEAFRDAMQNVNMELPNGHFEYDENRDPQISGVLMTYKDGVGVYYGEIKG